MEFFDSDAPDVIAWDKPARSAAAATATEKQGPSAARQVEQVADLLVQGVRGDGAVRDADQLPVRAASRVSRRVSAST